MRMYYICLPKLTAMRKFLILFFVLSFFSESFSQNKIISISPLINQQDAFNKSIINTLGDFLETKDPKYWLRSDLEKYTSPYSELSDIEAGKYGANFYKPSLMEIIATDEPNRKIVKIAFIGYHPEDKTNIIKAIYNVVANKVGNQVYFSKYLDLIIKNWKTVQRNNIKYYISPAKTINEEEVEKQHQDIIKISEFFDIEPFQITYYSTISPKELFELKGFEYHPMMYVDRSGGFAIGKDIILSANNSEYYTHEAVHLYTTKLFPNIDPYLDEGIATYFGGSGKFDFEWQKGKLKQFLTQNPDFKIEDHLDPYERIYFENETPILYILAGSICERTIRIYGKKKLFNIFKSKKDLVKILEEVGLSRSNINQELRKELGLK